MKKRLLIAALFLGALAGGFALVVLVALPLYQNYQNSQITLPSASLPAEYPQPDGRTLGDPAAPAKIEVYEDFQCPACNTYSQTIEPQVIASLVSTGLASYTFRNYPFLDRRVQGGNESHQAANAGMCAADQNLFWPFKALLFANQKAENSGGFSDEKLLVLAENAGLDMEAFTACFTSNAHQSEIDVDYALGYSLRVGGTPAVYVNGVNVKPGFVPSYEEIAAAVKAAKP